MVKLQALGRWLPGLVAGRPGITMSRDLARNEEFSEIAVINIFFTVLKTKTQLSVGGGGPAGKISR